MPTKSIVFATLITASLLAAQPPAQISGRVFNLTTRPNPQSLQEIATILHNVGDIQDLSIDAAASTVTVQGDPGQLALVGWIVQSLDAPPSVQTGSADTREYKIPGDGVVKVFYLSKPTTLQQVHEILTVLHNVVDVQKVFNYSSQNAIVARCDADRMTLVEKLISDLDKAPATK